VSLNLLISDLVTLPSAYADLSHQGVPVTARLVSCTEGGDDSCALSFTYADATTTWTYPQDTVQFDGVPIGSAVPLLVDRSDPSLRYTTYDVDSRFNAGFGIATVGGLVIMATGGVTVLLWVAVMRRMGRRRPGHAPGSHATGPRERG
jgi:hypothetical protein